MRILFVLMHGVCCNLWLDDVEVMCFRRLCHGGYGYIRLDKKFTEIVLFKKKSHIVVW